jgi:hypothetical protein
MWIYRKNRDNSARYVLGEIEENLFTMAGLPGNVFACFGINPSTAAPYALDPTLRQVKKRAEMYGYDGWLMFNIYPQRSTDPNGLHKEADRLLHKANMKAIRKYFKENTCDIWAAWGTTIEKRRYLKGCLSDIVGCIQKNPGNRWLKIGELSAQGHPHHPLYLPHEYGLEPFDIESYILGSKLQCRRGAAVQTIQ